MLYVVSCIVVVIGVLDDDATAACICDFTGMSLYTQRFKGLKCTVVCYFQGKIFNPTNLFNHVAPSIEFMMQM